MYFLFVSHISSISNPKHPWELVDTQLPVGTTIRARRTQSARGITYWRLVFDWWCLLRRTSLNRHEQRTGVPFKGWRAVALVIASSRLRACQARSASYVMDTRSEVMGGEMSRKTDIKNACVCPPNSDLWGYAKSPAGGVGCGHCRPFSFKGALTFLRSLRLSRGRRGGAAQWDRGCRKNVFLFYDMLSPRQRPTSQNPCALRPALSVCKQLEVNSQQRTCSSAVSYYNVAL